VFVEEDGRASERSVEVGRRTADGVEIGAGIEPGERIIVDGAGFLAAGVLVEAEARGTVGHAPVAPETEASTDQSDGGEEEGWPVNLPETSVRRHVLAVMLSAVILLFGAIAMQRIGVDRMPDVDMPVISVSTTYPGASAEVVDSSITEPMERGVNAVPGIR